MTQVPCERIAADPVDGAGGARLSVVSGFVSGLALCRSFYDEVVAPAVGVSHAAALLGPGSDVLGYDTSRSTDHDWGPRCQVFVQQPDLNVVRARVLASLPLTHRGWPVAIGRDGEQPEPQVVVATLPVWLRGELGWDLNDRDVSAVDWLLMPQTRLLGVTRGAVFVDPEGDLAQLRRRLAWYPDPVWWWLMACQWQRLAQEEPFVQRTAEIGDSWVLRFWRVTCPRLHASGPADRPPVGAVQQVAGDGLR